MAKLPCDPLALHDAIEDMKILLAHGMTHPPGWEHWVPDVQVEIHKLEAQLVALLRKGECELVPMTGRERNGQLVFRGILPQSVAFYESQGWRVIEDASVPQPDRPPLR